MALSFQLSAMSVSNLLVLQTFIGCANNTCIFDCFCKLANKSEALKFSHLDRLFKELLVIYAIFCNKLNVKPCS